MNTLIDTPYPSIIKNFGKENAKLVAQSTIEAIALIKSNVENLAINCGFEETSAYLFSQNSTQTEDLLEIYNACVDIELETRYVSENPVNIPFKKIIEVKGQAKFHPVRYVQALAKDFDQAGGVIIEECRVTDLVETQDLVEIITNKGERLYKAQSVIYATHIPPGVNLLHLKCAPYRSYAIAARLADYSYPEGLIYDMYDPYHYYRTQVIEGEKFLIAGGEDHKTGHEDNTEVPFRLLEEHLRKYFNVSEIVNKWSSQYFDSVDGLPYIGHLPGFSKNIYVATGYSGNGMVFSTVAAMILSDTLVGNKNRYSSLFSSERVKPIAGFTDFVKNNADVVKEFVGQLFQGKQLEELDLPEKGEGKIIVIDHHKVAISSDEQGILHALNPTCTHMKCSVTWNRAEQSWDCPCHGARFGKDGEVLTGPASRDLKSVNLQFGSKSIEDNS